MASATALGYAAAQGASVPLVTAVPPVKNLVQHALIVSPRVRTAQDAPVRALAAGLTHAAATAFAMQAFPVAGGARASLASLVQRASSCALEAPATFVLATVCVTQRPVFVLALPAGPQARALSSALVLPVATPVPRAVSATRAPSAMAAVSASAASPPRTVAESVQEEKKGHATTEASAIGMPPAHALLQHRQGTGADPTAPTVRRDGPV